MPEIEFLPDNVAGDADEQLRVRPPRVSARWVGIVAVAIVVATAVVVTSRRPESAPAPRVAAPSQVAVDLGSGFRTALSGRGPVLDVAALTGSSWVLRRDGLFVIRPGRAVARLVLPAALADPQLVADPEAGLVWLVANGLARSYDGRTLRPVFEGWAPPCDTVTAMGGRLFLTVDRDVVEVGPGLRVPRRIAVMPGPIVALAADPTRVRLILAYLGRPSRVVALAPLSAGRAAVEQTSILEVNEPTLAVAAGQIWLAGYSGSDALVRLDPTTLRAVAHSSIESALGLGAYLAGAGASTVWVRGAGDGGELRCLDATTGRQLQSWLLSGRVAATARRALVGTVTGALQLDLAHCAG